MKFSVDLMGADQLYGDDDIAKLTEKDMIEGLREDVWLEEVYGATSRRPNEEWLKAVAGKKANWIFKPEDCREKIFKEANVAKKH